VNACTLSESIQWLQHYRYDLAKRQSQLEHMPLFLTMEQPVYSSPDVILALNECISLHEFAEPPRRAALPKAIRAHSTHRLFRIANDAMKPLAHAVARFCDTLVRIPDSSGMPEEPDAHTKIDRVADTDNLRDIACEIRQHLVHLGIAIDDARRGTARGSQQRRLHRFQRAYRSLQSLMIGVPDKFLDAHLLPEKPTIRSHLERGEIIHRSLIDELSKVPDRTPGPMRWESVADRLGRHLLDCHVDLNSLLNATRHRRTETSRLAQKIFLALGSAEGAMIGAETEFESSCRPLIDFIHTRTYELARLCSN